MRNLRSTVAPGSVALAVLACATLTANQGQEGKWQPEEVGVVRYLGAGPQGQWTGPWLVVRLRWLPTNLRALERLDAHSVRDFLDGQARRMLHADVYLLAADQPLHPVMSTAGCGTLRYYFPLPSQRPETLELHMKVPLISEEPFTAKVELGQLPSLPLSTGPMKWRVIQVTAIEYSAKLQTQFVGQPSDYSMSFLRPLQAGTRLLQVRLASKQSFPAGLPAEYLRIDGAKLTFDGRTVPVAAFRMTQFAQPLAEGRAEVILWFALSQLPAGATLCLEGRYLHHDPQKMRTMVFRDLPVPAAWGTSE